MEALGEGGDFTLGRFGRESYSSAKVFTCHVV